MSGKARKMSAAAGSGIDHLRFGIVEGRTSQKVRSGQFVKAYAVINEKRRNNSARRTAWPGKSTRL